MRTSARVGRIQGEKANYRKRGLLCKIKYMFGSTRILHQIIKEACVTHTVLRNAGRKAQPHKASLVLGFITNVGPHVVPILIDGKHPFDFTENRIRPLQSSWLGEGLKNKVQKASRCTSAQSQATPEDGSLLHPTPQEIGFSQLCFVLSCWAQLNQNSSKANPHEPKIK